VGRCYEHLVSPAAGERYRRRVPRGLELQHASRDTPEHTHLDLTRAPYWIGICSTCRYHLRTNKVLLGSNPAAPANYKGKPARAEPDRAFLNRERPVRYNTTILITAPPTPIGTCSHQLSPPATQFKPPTLVVGRKVRDLL